MEQKKPRHIPVLEIFGPTIQGEGMVIGQKTMFIRTAGCDYKCSWCDSAFTWDGSAKDQIEMLEPARIRQRLYDKASEQMRSGEYGHHRNFDHVTISGGNPALIGVAMADLIKMLHRDQIKVGLETQGSRWQDWFLEIDDLTISPKPPSSGMETNWEKLCDIIRKLDTACSIAHKPHNFTLKVVVFRGQEADWEYAKKIRAMFPQVQMYISVGNLDVSSLDNLDSHRKQLLEDLDWLFDKICGDAEMNNVRPLPQLHTLVWGNRRGV